MPLRSPGAAFLRGLIANPRKVGAIAPSSFGLAKLMAASLEIDPHRFTLELGPGTGAITQALLDAGLPAKKLIAIEHSGHFVRQLAARFSGAEFVQGDVFEIKSLMAHRRLAGGIGGTISGLPLLTLPVANRQGLYEDVFDLMEPGAPLVQFTYRPAPPVPTDGTSFETRCAGRVLRNLPPAWVWCYHRPAVAYAATAAC